MSVALAEPASETLHRKWQRMPTGSCAKGSFKAQHSLQFNPLSAQGFWRRSDKYGSPNIRLVWGFTLILQDWPISPPPRNFGRKTSSGGVAGNFERFSFVSARCWVRWVWLLDEHVLQFYFTYFLSFFFVFYFFLIIFFFFVGGLLII